jgi:hypothetical protein
MEHFAKVITLDLEAPHSMMFGGYNRIRCSGVGGRRARHRFEQPLEPAMLPTDNGS